VKEEGQVLGSRLDEEEWVQLLMVVVHVALPLLLAESAEILTVLLEREWMIEVGPHQCRHRYADSGRVRRVVGEPVRGLARDLGLE